MTSSFLIHTSLHLCSHDLERKEVLLLKQLNLSFPLLVVSCSSRLGWRRGTAEDSTLTMIDTALCGGRFPNPELSYDCYERISGNLQLRRSLSLNTVCDQTSPCTPHPPPTTPDPQETLSACLTSGGTTAYSVDASLSCYFSPSLFSLCSNEHRR